MHLNGCLAASWWRVLINWWCFCGSLGLCFGLVTFPGCLFVMMLLLPTGCSTVLNTLPVWGGHSFLSFDPKPLTEGQPSTANRAALLPASKSSSAFCGGSSKAAQLLVRLNNQTSKQKGNKSKKVLFWE